MTKPNKQPFFITTAISYPNGLPHIGHAYEIIATDVIARFKRLDGYEVKFLTGTDDHGQKMFRTARDKGTTPQALADEITPHFRTMAERFNCTHDDFIRTSESRHHKAVAALWQRMADAGDIYKDSYKGWYAVQDECFYTESELSENEQGDKIAPTGASVEWVAEESYFFRLSAYQDKLLALYDAQPDFICPRARRNEIIAFIKGEGLKDLSISRTSFNWGVSVPNDPSHIVYVWVDALANYLTALGYPDDMGAWWPAQLHVIGKDITRFHAVYWPAFLMSAGLAVPKQIFAHGFLTMHGQKMSKSTGNVMNALDMVETYGADVLRYFFMRHVPFGSDGNFDHAMLIKRVNADLANDLGNLAQRSLSMIAKNCNGILPQADPLTKADEALLAQADGLYDSISQAMARLEIHTYLAQINELVAATNRYFDKEQAWVLQKTDPARMGVVLYVTAEIVRQLALAIQPVVPNGAARLLDYLAVPQSERGFSQFGKAGRLASGSKLPTPAPVFTRLTE